MFEIYSEPMKAASHYARALAKRRGETVEHTGHLLCGIFATGAQQSVSGLPGGSEIVEAIERLLEQGVPAELIRHTLQRRGISDAYALSTEAAIMRTRERGSKTVTTTDVVWGLLSSGPNVATYLLEHVAVDCASLHDSLREAAS